MKTRKYIRLAVGLLMACVATSVAAQVADKDLYNNNVVIVLDASGSMDGKMSDGVVKKMDAAKSALIEVLKQVPMDTHIGLLVFQNDWVYPLGPRDDARLTEAINSPQPDGVTPLGAYIKRGADRLLEQRKAQHGYGAYRLLVVTDGVASDQELLNRFAPDVVARGITMDVIGVGMKKRHMLSTLAHSYRSANDPESLKRAVAEVFAEVGGAGDGGSASEDAFAELEPIPTELAAAMLQALASSGNQPIGERAMSSSTPAMSTAPSQHASSAHTTRAPAPPRPTPPSSRRALGKVITIAGFIVVIFSLFVFRTAMRKF